MHQFKRRYPHTIFDQYGSVQPDATAGDMLHQMFQTPNSNAHDLLEKIALVAVDDLDLVNRMLESDDPDCEMISRVLLRMRDRLAVGVSLHKRCAENEAKASEPEVSP